MSISTAPIQSAGSNRASIEQSSSTIRRALYPIYLEMKGKVAPGWEIIQPLRLVLDRETDGTYLVSDDIFNVYGQGITAKIAVFDYLISLREYYQIVSEHEDIPSQNHFAYLQEYLRHIPD